MKEINEKWIIVLECWLAFCLKFIWVWAGNTDNQLIQFFGLHEGFGLSVLKVILPIIIVLCGLAVFSLGTFVMGYGMNLFESISVYKNEERYFRFIALGMALVSLKIYGLVEKQLSNIWDHSMHSTSLLMASFLFLLITGNPIINCYYGVYKKWDVGASAKQNIVSKQDVQQTIDYMESHMADDESYDVGKEGYIFKRAGLIAGYYAEKHYSGLWQYLLSVCLFAVERLICTVMYFFLPLIITQFSLNKYSSMKNRE